MEQTPGFFTGMMTTLLAIVVIGIVWGFLHCHKIGWYTFCTS